MVNAMLVFGTSREDSLHYNINVESLAEADAFGKHMRTFHGRPYAYSRSAHLSNMVEGKVYQLTLTGGVNPIIRWVADGELMPGALDYCNSSSVTIVHEHRMSMSKWNASSIALTHKFKDMCKQYLAHVYLDRIVFLCPVTYTPKYSVPIITTPVYFS